MSRISARLIGQKLGKSAREVNIMLEKIGFIVKSKCTTKNGSPIWDITDLGKLHGELSHNPYSNGHIWDSEVAELLKRLFQIER